MKCDSTSIISTINLEKVLVALWFSIYSVFAVAEIEFMDDWNINGSNTLRSSVYSADGPGTASPYPSEGGMYFDEFNVYLSKQNSRYDTMRGEISGVYNVNDDYRSSDFGMVPERMRFLRENGDADIPYRAEFGDHFAYYSYLTLQRSLKGAQLELQPNVETYGYRHSFVMTTGASESNWRDLTLQDDYTTGLSWLMQNEQGGFSLNMVHNFRDNSFKAGTLDRNQYVFSLAGQRQFNSPDYNVSIEGEIAHFLGDHNGVSGAASGQDKAGNGYFFQVSGQSKTMPWDYRLRFDRYDQDFQPNGAIVSSDRRSFELHSGWLHQSGVRSRGRIQFFEDGFETTNKTSTRTYGMNFTGPLLKMFVPDVNGSLDAFVQKRDNETKTVEVTTHNVNLNLSKPLSYGWFGRGTVFIQNVNDESGSGSDALTRQVSFNADHSITFAGFQGVIAPGIMLRTLRKGTTDSTDFNPTLALSLNRGPHALRMDYGSLVQNRSVAVSGPDLNTHTLNLDYRYTNKQHVFGLESNLFGRDPDPGESTEAYRISAYWTYQFDRPATTLAARTTALGVDESTPTEAEVSIPGLAPGLTEDAVQLALSNAGVGNGAPQAGWVVYEYPLLSDVFRRQRLALEFVTGSLERSALVIDFENVGDRDSVVQTFERIRQTLIRQLGSPTRTIEEGQFAASFVTDVNAQRLIRIVEWNTSSGVIRFGIPRRLDNQVRMEIQHARRFPQPRETLWSIEGIR
ncbi:MAG: hypothetical protein DHS20C09_02450 [marine bacterium B5-7]|nr:MAG: hypothetical protein DHS20C09_02450 [marine bacterium B5-7]